MTALLLAAKAGSRETVGALVAAGANVNALKIVRTYNN